MKDAKNRFSPEDLEKIKEEIDSVVEVLKAHHMSFVLVTQCELFEEDGSHHHVGRTSCELFEATFTEREHIANELRSKAGKAIDAERHSFSNFDLTPETD